MKVLIISPFHGHSSHAAWAKGFAAHSRHQVRILPMLDRSWSWRLKGSSVPLAQAMLTDQDLPQVLMVTSFTCLSSLMGMLRRTAWSRLPVVYYMHENQLTYPIRPGGKRDSQLALRQFHSHLVADEIWFNSEYHRRCWFSQLPKFLGNFPDHRGVETIPSLENKSKVVPVGLTLPTVPFLAGRKGGRPLLMWNQRWEWEKGIDRFVDFVKKFGKSGSFDVVLLGENPREGEPLRAELREFLGERLLHDGWCEREEYCRWLERADFTVSTSRHEFFGISLLEAAAYQTVAFLPDGLSYRELLPAELQEQILYRSPKRLYRLVKQFLQNPGSFKDRLASAQSAAYRFEWSTMSATYDRHLEALTCSAGSPQRSSFEPDSR